MSITLHEGETKSLNVNLTPIPLEPATLFGTIINADTGTAVIGATVTITGPATYSDTSDSTGAYRITNIIPGAYNGEVSHPDYETAYF